MLDDARFFIEGFIKGPVCRGQVALNVIDDRFWVFFFSPDRPVMANRDEFIAQMADYLKLPADRGSDSLNVLTPSGPSTGRDRRPTWTPGRPRSKRCTPSASMTPWITSGTAAAPIPMPR